MNELTQELKEIIQSTQPRLKEKVAQDHWRLYFHQQPPTGWLNDPNGVCQVDGVYHLYYQYSPIQPEKGLVYWGHKTSTDLVNFEDQDIFLYPDQPFDCHGVYSGTTFYKDGVHHIFYTGNVKHEGDHDYDFSGREQNTIHMTSKDGFKIDSREVVIPYDAYPKGFSQHIRDPKIFEKNNQYYMILGGRTLENKGAVLVYESEDLEEWSYKSLLLDEIENMGYMWECPDFFTLNGKDVFLFSPQGVEQQKHEFANVYQSGYFIGEMEWDSLTFTPTHSFVELDRGFDFYAPQTFEDESGRRILWGWMGLPDTDYENPTVQYGWQHAMTMPRELCIEDGKLKQKPLPEYQSLRKEEYRFDGEIDGEFTDRQLSGEVYELLVSREKSEQSLSICLRQDTVLSFDKGLLTLSHGASGYGRTERSIELESVEQLQIFSDTSSLEIFINDGEHVMTTRLYPQEGQNGIAISGNEYITIQKWNLEN